MESDDDRVSEARTGIAYSSMTLMDAVDIEALKALGECIEANERFATMMQERDVETEAVTAMLLAGVVRAVHD